MIKINKVDAAKRHLNFAIRSYFEGNDIVPIMALIGAAHVISHDLVDNERPQASWAHFIAEMTNKSINKILFSLREITNWLKHADKDPHSEIEFDHAALDILLFHTLLDLGCLNVNSHKVSPEASIFQLWFIAKYSEIFNTPENAELLQSSKDTFPNLASLSLGAQLQKGLEVLNIDFTGYS